MNAYRRAVVSLAVAGMIVCLAVSTAPAASMAGEPAAPTVGQPPPDFELTLFNGNKVALKDLRGKAVLIVFWRSG
jgi:cytochrome oxidase Cu insertion factor (SCO1/SenC/PrrC family)